MKIDSLYLEMEREMLEIIARQLRTDMRIDPTGTGTHWRVAQLANFGQLNNRQLAILRKYSGLSKQELLKWVEDTGVSTFTQFDEAFEKQFGLELPIGENTVRNRLSVLEKEALDTFGRIDASMLKGTHTIYRDIITQASMDVLLGQKSLYESVRDNTKKWASDGIPVLKDASGRTWGTEGYVTMVIRQTQKNVSVAMQEQRFDDYDMDIVEISQHMGSRPTHVEYQGNRYSRSGRSTIYPPLDKTTYGDITGIVTGIGCRHHMYGVHPDTHEPLKLPEQDAVETQDNYIESQKQRYLERQIRKAKREESILKELGATPDDLRKARDKVLLKQSSMRSFIKETGSVRRRGREGAWSGTVKKS